MSETDLHIEPGNIPRDMQERRRLAEALSERAAATFQGGDVGGATRQAANLLMLFPNERRYLDRFDEIVLSVDDPLALLTLPNGDLQVDLTAGRARVLMMARRLAEALTLVCKAVEVAPHVPYLHWILRWLQPPIIQSLDWGLLLETAVRTAFVIGRDTPNPPPRHDRRVPNLRAGAEYLAAIRQVHPDRTVLWVGEILLRRRLKDANALSLAHEAAQRFPSDADVRAELVGTLREAGRTDEAVQLAASASTESKAGQTAIREAAWSLVEEERYEEAVPLFERLAEGPAAPDGAEASACYARFRARQDQADLHALSALRERRWWDEEAQRLADEVSAPLPFINVLPFPEDRTGLAARAFFREAAAVQARCGGPIALDLKLRSRYLESPTVPVAFELAVASAGGEGELKVEVEGLQKPDPRADKAPVSTPVWRYEHAEAIPVYAEGAPEAQFVIAEIARGAFRKDRWTQQAAEVASRFGNESYHGLMSVLTHPPAPEGGFDAFTWTWRCQVATALVISHLGGWESGAAKAGVYSMVYGPSDWVSAAAVVALMWRAADEPGIRQEVEPIFEWLRQLVPSDGVTAWERPLVELWLQLPCDEERRAQLEEWRARLDSPTRHEGLLRPPSRRYGGLELHEYASFSLERDRMLSRLGWPAFGGMRPDLDAEEAVPRELVAVCVEHGVPPRDPETDRISPYIEEWEVALSVNVEVRAAVEREERQRALAYLTSPEEDQEALESLAESREDIRQQLSGEAGAGEADDADPIVFPGQAVQRLGEYVALLKEMRLTDMHSTLARHGLEIQAYSAMAQAWGNRINADPALQERFHRLMES